LGEKVLFRDRAIMFLAGDLEHALNCCKLTLTAPEEGATDRPAAAASPFTSSAPPPAKKFTLLKYTRPMVSHTADLPEAVLAQYIAAIGPNSITSICGRFVLQQIHNLLQICYTRNPPQIEVMEFGL